MVVRGGLRLQTLKVRQPRESGPVFLAGHELMSEHSSGVFQWGGGIPVLSQSSHFCIFALNLVYNLSYCEKAKVKKKIKNPQLLIFCVDLKVVPVPKMPF